ncbi:MAG: AraC family transcriptional regulator [Lachnospiraceae bacterium]|nr:AraC family transcriptional regulator [Lachnospiraceae bacterium]
MSEKKLEEKMSHGTLELPVGIHKMNYDKGLDVFYYSHWHKEFELFLCIDGRVEISVEDESFVMEKDDVVFINSNQLHSAKPVDGGSAAFFAVDFMPAILEKDRHSNFYMKYVGTVLEGKVKFQNFIKKSEAVNDGWGEKLVLLLKDLYACPEHDLSGDELMIRGHIMEMWNLLYSNAVEKNEMTKHELLAIKRFKPVVKYIDENYEYDISLAELAALIPMSEGQFCRSFRSVMGYSPVQYMNRYRILKSCHLLRETDDKISEIANRCGFRNISYFNKVFLRTIGCKPNEYRKGESGL